MDDQLEKELRAQIDELKAKFDGVMELVSKLQGNIDGMYITGDGFSGSGYRGIKFTPPEPSAITATAVCNDDGTITITINA